WERGKWGGRGARRLAGISKPLERGRQSRSLVDGALGVELGGHVGAADEVGANAQAREGFDQLAQRLLAGTEDDRVPFEALEVLALLAEGDDEPRFVDRFVVHARDHLDALHLERRTVDPARGLAEPLANPARLWLQHVDL